MDIKEIRFANFKAFREMQSIPLRPLTLVFGQNSSGKSSILDAVLWASHMAADGVPYNYRTSFATHRFDFDITGYRLQLGCFKDFVHGKDNSQGIRLGFTSGDLSITENMADYEIEVGEDGIDAVSLAFKEESVFESKRDFKNKMDEVWHTLENLIPISAGNRLQTIVTDQLSQFKTNDLRLWLDAFKDDAMGEIIQEYFATKYDDFIANVYLIAGLMVERKRLSTSVFPPSLRNPLQSSIHGLQFLQALQGGALEDKRAQLRSDFITRIAPQFITNLPAHVKMSLIDQLAGMSCDLFAEEEQTAARGLQMGLHRVAYIGPMREALDLERLLPANLLRGDPDIYEKDYLGWRLDENALSYANGWLSKLGPREAHYRFSISERKTLELFDVRRNIAVGLTEVGSGISQIMPVILAAAGYKSHLVCIKQPELHLHPALQAELAEVFIKFAKEDGTHFLLETHSEHLLLRMLRRIRETTEGTLPEGSLPLRPDDVSVLYVENLGDHSVVQRMPINENGQLVRDWPGGFFEEGLREVLQ